MVKCKHVKEGYDRVMIHVFGASSSVEFPKSDIKFIEAV